MTEADHTAIAEDEIEADGGYRENEKSAKLGDQIFLPERVGHER